MSHRKISANRRNAQRSTGPRSFTGKARSKRNARRHGLSMRSASGPEQNAEIQALAIAMIGPDPDPTRLHFAHDRRRGRIGIASSARRSHKIYQLNMPERS